MKNIFARLYCFYGIIMFLITMLPTALFFWIARNFCKKETAEKLVQHGFQVWMGFYMPIIFCPVKYVGREKFEKGKNYVVVLNHNSLADVPVSSPGIPGPNKTLAKIEMSRIPIFGYIYKAGSILLDRDDIKSRQESYNKMIATLNENLHLCLFPEGTRNKTSEPIARFFDGAFKVAILAQKPVIPGLIFGTKNILHPTKKFWAWPHKIEMHFLDPIETENLEVKETDALKQKVFQLMKAYFIENNQRFI